MGEEPRRYKLQAELESLLGSSNVYFNPSSNVNLSYPCIIYSVSRKDIRHADDMVYKNTTGYDVTYIRRVPDSDVIDNLLIHFPKSRYDRSFISENLYHDVLVIYF